MGQDPGSRSPKWDKEDIAMKRVLTIQDISCVGKCSASVVLPVLSALGVEAALLPTALLSTHTMFSKPAVRSLEDMTGPITEHWLAEGIGFDAIYSGYLASEKQVRMVEDLFGRFGGSENTLRFVDPAMADHGKLYSGFTADFPEVMKRLCARADYIVPNLTEAYLLTGREYCSEPDTDQLHALLEELAAIGTGKAVIITGAVSNDKAARHAADSAETGMRNSGAGITGASGLDIRTGEFFEIRQRKLDAAFPGTGDLFAAVTVGALTRGIPLKDSLQLAADFVYAAIKETLENDPDKDRRFGVDFEPVLSLLTAV